MKRRDFILVCQERRHFLFKIYLGPPSSFIFAKSQNKEKGFADTFIYCIIQSQKCMYSKSAYLKNNCIKSSL